MAKRNPCQLNVPIPPELKDRLVALADRQGRFLGRVVRDAVEVYVARFERAEELAALEKVAQP